MSSLLDLADSISEYSSDTVRLVTFQSKSVLDEVCVKGRMQSAYPLRQPLPAKFTKVSDESSYFLVNKTQVITADKSSTELQNLIVAGNVVEYIVPFRAYYMQRYCGELRHMSIQLIYKMASYFMGGLDFSERSIVELDVPREFIMFKRDDSQCVYYGLSELRQEWIVSRLDFVKWVTEVAHGENALLYKNTVLRDLNYHMCYSDDVILNGHGHGDNVDAMLSSELLPNVYDTAVLRDYIQPKLYNMLVGYLYIIRHNKSLADIVGINMRDAHAEMPMVIGQHQVKAFKNCIEEIMSLKGVALYEEGSTYKERIKTLSR